MMNLESIIDNYKLQSGKNAKRAGNYTKIFLKYNRKLIKEGLTEIYAREGYFHNVETGRDTKIKYDTRFKDKKVIRKKFLEKYMKKDDKRIVTNVQWSDDTLISMLTKTGWTTENNLNNNNLLRNLIKDNNISGNWRITLIGIRDGVKDKIIDKSYFIDNDFWSLYKNDFIVDSDFMIWNTMLNDNEVEYDKVIFVFSKDTKLPYVMYEQSFKDGLNHCVFQPILDWAKDKLESAKTKATKDRYITKINKINGKVLKTGQKKIGLEEQYILGVPQSKISEVAEELQIGFVIEQPFNPTPLYEYKSNKKPLKIFKFVNTRLNHIEENKTPLNYDSLYSSDNNIIDIETFSEMETIYNNLNLKNEMCIINRAPKGITKIRTLSEVYAKSCDFYTTINEFELDSGLIDCSIDGLRYPLLQAFLDKAIQFNCCVDLKDTSMFKNGNIPETIKHIDMIKAYSQYKKCKNYCGFMGKITDFRKVNNFKQNGIYFIEKLNLNKCNDKFKQINDMLNIYQNYNSYTKAELHYLENNGGTFRVVYGAYGLDIDFDFSEDMLNKKEDVSIGENVKKISYYAKYCGMISSTYKNKKFHMKGDSNFFSTIKNSAFDIYHNEDNNEACVSYPKKYMYNKKHITAQITAYQRLNMMEQLETMDLDKIVRICVDGIYYEDHDFEMNSDFDKKIKMTFVNDPATQYLSNINFKEQYEQIPINEIPEAREFYYRELYLGQGGNGKTYYNLNDTGLINSIYIAHSWKLATTQQNEYNEKTGNYLHANVFHNLSNTNGDNTILNKYSNYIIDEASMISEKARDYYFKNIKGRIIMCGDLGYQLPPVNGETEMKTESFDKVITFTKNYRFTCEKLINIIHNVRWSILNKTSIDFTPFNVISKDEVINLYNKDDIILVSQGATKNKGPNNYNNYWNEILDIEKYKITNNTRNYKNGDIVYEKIEIGGVECELRHGYTIHSLQGSTHTKKLFIDMRKIGCERMFYTAISRAKMLSQIYLVRN